jgi:hypothetical protein
MPATDEQDKAYRCSFCGKRAEQVRRLIAGPGHTYICDECVDLWQEILDEEGAPNEGAPRPGREQSARKKSRRKAGPTPLSGSVEAHVRERFDDIVLLGHLHLEQINSGRHSAEHYCTMQEYVRELWARANAVSDFAVSIGLISGEQALRIITDFLVAHPDVPTEGPPRGRRESTDAG